MGTRASLGVALWGGPWGAGWGSSRVRSTVGVADGRRQEPRQRWNQSLWRFRKAGRAEGAKKGVALSPQWPLIVTYWGDRQGKPQNLPDTGGQLTCVWVGRLGKPTSLCQRREEGAGQGTADAPPSLLGQFSGP